MFSQEVFSHWNGSDIEQDTTFGEVGGHFPHREKTMNLFFNKTKIIKNINTNSIKMIFALFELFVQNVLTTFGRMCFQG